MRAFQHLQRGVSLPSSRRKESGNEIDHETTFQDSVITMDSIDNSLRTTRLTKELLSQRVDKDVIKREEA